MKTQSTYDLIYEKLRDLRLSDGVSMTPEISTVEKFIAATWDYIDYSDARRRRERLEAAAAIGVSEIVVGSFVDCT